MTQWATGQKLGVALCEAVGLNPDEVRALTLHCDVGGPALLTVHFPVDADGVAALAAAFKVYELVER